MALGGTKGCEEAVVGSVDGGLQGVPDELGGWAAGKLAVGALVAFHCAVAVVKADS